VTLPEVPTCLMGDHRSADSSQMPHRKDGRQKASFNI